MSATTTSCQRGSVDFRAGRGTMDMIFTARQLQEKCREHQRELYAVFVDLTKAFDSVDRPVRSLGDLAQNWLSS